MLKSNSVNFIFVFLGFSCISSAYHIGDSSLAIVEQSNALNNDLDSAGQVSAEGLRDRFPCLLRRCIDEDEEVEYSQTWSDSVYDTLTGVAPWAKIAYCEVFPWSKTFVPGPLSEACPNIAFCNESSSGVEVVHTFDPYLIRNNTISGSGYVAADHDKKQVIISFRGTASLGDWISDISIKLVDFIPIIGSDFRLTDFESLRDNYSPEQLSSIIESKVGGKKKMCENCRVHFGVYYAYSVLIPRVFEAAKPYLDSGYQLVITGQSLGGGYTHMAAIDFLLAGYKPLVISYASLKIGNGYFNAFVDEKFNTKESAEIIASGGDLPIPSVTRVYQQNDIVPRLPPGNTYTHSGLKFEISKIRPPHLKENVHFRGISDNWYNPPFNYDFTDPLSLTISYQHHYQFVRHSVPCNDLDLIFKIIPVDSWKKAPKKSQI